MSYQANDPEQVYEWLNRYIAAIPGKPDQFSTADERGKYGVAMSERLKLVGQIPIIGKCQKKYDSYREAFEVKAGLFSMKNSYGMSEVQARAVNLKLLTVATKNIKRDTYTGQNAYGAETQISRTSSDVYALAFPLNQTPGSALVSGTARLTTMTMPYESDFYYLQFDVPMPSATARANAEDIACLYVFSIEPPYTIKFSQNTTATRDMPFEDNADFYALYGRLDQMAVINTATGDVYEQAAR